MTFKNYFNIGCYFALIGCVVWILFLTHVIKLSGSDLSKNIQPNNVPVKVQDTVFNIVQVPVKVHIPGKCVHDTIIMYKKQTIFDTIRGEDCIVYQKDSFPNDSTDRRITAIRNNRITQPVTNKNGLKLYAGGFAGMGLNSYSLAPVVGISTDNRHLLFLKYDLIQKVGSVGVVWRLGK